MFLSLQGYAVYVWPCYILLLLLCVGQVYFTLRSGRLISKKLVKRLKNV